MIYFITIVLIIAIVAYFGLKSKKVKKGKGANVGIKEPVIDGKEHLHDLKQN